MRLPLIWLKDYTDVKTGADGVAALFTRIGFEVEEIIREGSGVLEVAVTPNRADCQSILGLAREYAAASGAALKEPETTFKSTRTAFPVEIKVEETELCPRYAGAYVRGVKIAPSPEFISERLTACGIKPVNNIVDITNFVLLEYGQPMHAFNAAKISGGVTVRLGKKGEKLKTLDGAERDASGALLIADNVKPLALAGIMGGEESKITDGVTEVFLESAVFARSVIRKTSSALGLRTDASARFEKGMDTETCLHALKRALYLIEKCGAGRVAGALSDVNNSPGKARLIKFGFKEIESKLGISVPEKTVLKILNALNIKSEITDGRLICRPPYYRTDVTAPADITEEVIRSYGYGKLKPTLLTAAAPTRGGLDAKTKTVRDVKDFFVGNGFYESVTLSFTSRKTVEKLNLDFAGEEKELVPLVNPLGEDFRYLRKTNAGNILNVLALNAARKNRAASYFEAANNFTSDGGAGRQAKESLTLTAASAEEGRGFYYMKGLIDAVLSKHGLTAKYTESKTAYLHPGISADIIIGGASAGRVGEVHPTVLAAYDIKGRAYLAELALAPLIAADGRTPVYTPYSRFPSVTRDVSLVVADEVRAGDITESIRNLKIDVLTETAVTDVFKGADFAGKSVTVRLIFGSCERTLKVEEADAAVAQIVKSLGEKFKASLRT